MAGPLCIDLRAPPQVIELTSYIIYWLSFALPSLSTQYPSTSRNVLEGGSCRGLTYILFKHTVLGLSTAVIAPFSFSLSADADKDGGRRGALLPLLGWKRVAELDLVAYESHLL